MSSNRISEDGERVHDAMSNLVARPQSLQDYLLEQFGFFSCPPEVREFAEFLIQNLDGNGRLPGSLEKMARIIRTISASPSVPTMRRRPCR